PAVASLSATSGLTSGGDTLTVTGSNFTGATQVLFGAVPAPSFTVSSDSTLTVTTPVQAAGTFDVTVVTPWGASAPVSQDRFTYTAPPALRVVPTRGTRGGPGGGGPSAATTGRTFPAATRVAFGTATAPSFVVNSATSITAVAPPGLSGTIDVTVTTAAGVSAV